MLSLSVSPTEELGSGGTRKNGNLDLARGHSAKTGQRELSLLLPFSLTIVPSGQVQKKKDLMLARVERDRGRQFAPWSTARRQNT